MRRFIENRDGGTAIEMSLMALMMMLLTGGAIEAGYAYHQHGSAQHAVRHAARLAALSDPVAHAIEGNPTAFDVQCEARAQSCAQGSFDRDAFNRIFYGADNDGTCARTKADRRGLCDVFTGASTEDVIIRYRRERTGDMPSVTVTLRERPMQTVVMGAFLPDRFKTLPAVSATLTGGDLNG
jgi:Flp pilus assembly protein TadG